MLAKILRFLFGKKKKSESEDLLAAFSTRLTGEENLVKDVYSHVNSKSYWSTTYNKSFKHIYQRNFKSTKSVLKQINYNDCK